MKRIVKNNEPHSLTLHRLTDYADYNNYPQKDELRLSLSTEQRGICCYCMGSISPNTLRMKIEHYKSQENFPDEQLDYRNLLGACKGGEGQPEKLQHCDTFKGQKILNFYPPAQVPNIEDMITYENDGRVSSFHNQLNTELNDVLNLNNLRLVITRKAVLDGFKQFIELTKKKKSLNRVTLEKWLGDWDGSANNDALRPYCMVVVYWIKKRLDRV